MPGDFILKIRARNARKIASDGRQAQRMSAIYQFVIGKARAQFDPPSVPCILGRCDPPAKIPHVPVTFRKASILTAATISRQDIRMLTTEELERYEARPYRAASRFGWPDRLR